MADNTKINIEIEYITHNPEQTVCLNLSSSKKLRAELNEPIRLKSTDGRLWQQTIELPTKKISDLDYGFTVSEKFTLVDEEKGHGTYPHHIFFNGYKKINIQALWHNDKGKNYLYSSAFSKTVYPFEINEEDKVVINRANVNLIFTDYIPPVGYKIFLCGNNDATGNWNPHKGIEGRQIHMGTWSFPLNGDLIEPEDFLFKYVLINSNTNNIIWEEGNNRSIKKLDRNYEKTIIDTYTPCMPQNDLKIAGVVVPVFSLRSNNSWAIGDFGDLRKLIDWAYETKLNAIQILPINDTTREGNWHDSYPYNPISSFALHPIYMDFNDLPKIKSRTKLKIYEQQRQILNEQELLDYDEAFKLKESYLHTFYEENKQEILRSTKYKNFKKENADWLVPYSFFRYLLKVNDTANFRKWPKFREYNQVELQRWATANNLLDKIEFYGVLQFLLDNQLKNIHEYAQSKNIILKGDIPIGVSRDSVTAWVLPKYLNQDCQAGAPPDVFSAHGQNWGFPTYNWKNILADNASWWTNRLVHMSQYFDAYRIDHVLGFFRIWEIPITHYYGTLGHFNPGLPLTPQELLILGFTDDPEYYTFVHFTEGEMQKHFGELLPVAKEYFFKFGTDGKWTLLEKYAHSQRAIDHDLKELGFSGQQRELFLSAYTNVLFIKTSPDAKQYYLNILGKKTKEYKHLTKNNASAYDRIFQYFFYERHNKFWTEIAYQRLPRVIYATPMLACAEDLGMIPDCVPKVLKDLNVLTLEIESMPKTPHVKFSDLSKTPFYSVDTISTHDMPPLRLWWKQNPDKNAEYWNNVLAQSSPIPSLLSAQDCELIIRHHIKSNSLLCILSLQDWLSISEELRSDNLEQEQINHPEIPRHYWRWRMVPSIEQLASDIKLTKKIREIIKLRNNTLI